MIIATHVVSELVQTSLKMTQTYFDETRIIQSKLKNCVQNSIFAKYQYLFYDDSTFMQWYYRNSIDVSIRFSVSAVSALWQIMDILLLGDAMYQFTNKQINIALIYTTFAFLVEFVCFIGAFIQSKSIVKFYCDVWKLYLKEFIVVWIACMSMTYVIRANP